MTKVVAVVWVRNSFNSMPHYRFSIRMIWGKRYIEPTLGRMDASEKWKIIWFPPHQATTLPKWIAANWLVRHSILYPEQQRAATTFAFPSVCFFFYGSILCKSGFLFVTLFSLLWDLFPKLENGFPTMRLISQFWKWHVARGADAAPPGGPALVCTTGPVADGEWTLDRGNEDMWGGGGHLQYLSIRQRVVARHWPGSKCTMGLSFFVSLRWLYNAWLRALKLTYHKLDTLAYGTKKNCRKYVTI